MISSINKSRNYRRVDPPMFQNSQSTRQTPSLTIKHDQNENISPIHLNAGYHHQNTDHPTHVKNLKVYIPHNHSSSRNSTSENPRADTVFSLLNGVNPKRLHNSQSTIHQTHSISSSDKLISILPDSVCDHLECGAFRCKYRCVNINKTKSKVTNNNTHVSSSQTANK